MVMLAKKTNMCKTCLIAAFTALLPVTAAAIEMPDWYLSGGMSYTDSERRSNDDLAPYIGVGGMFGDRYSLDVEYKNYSFDLGGAGDVDIDVLNLNGRYYFLGNDNTSPYVGVGVGWLQNDGPFGEGSDQHFDLAAGVQWLFGDQWGLKGEVRHRFGGDNDAQPPGDEFKDLIINLGLTYALSPRVQPGAARNWKAYHRSDDADGGVPKTTFILLPDENGSVGRVIVSNDAGEEEISQAGYGVDVASTQVAPAKPKKADQAELDKVFGAVQGAFPVTPRHYQIYFQYDSTELAAGSKLQMPEIVTAIEAHNSVEIAVVGHSDTFGKQVYNLNLAERRADAIVRLLTEMGVRKELIVSRSDGENNPAIPTADNVKERKNRRVEISIR